MGAHAFDIEPGHCALYRAVLGDQLPPLHGLAERWNVPIAQHRCVIGADAYFGAVDHYVLTYHSGGGTARRTDGFSDAIGRRGTVSLQRPLSGTALTSDGVVEYAHLYFKQSLLCEVADEVQPARPAEPQDFFAAFDRALSHDIKAYLDRIRDRSDPPTAIEMDSRAYLITLGLLRTAKNCGGAPLLRECREGRAELGRVLTYIDDHLGQPLRLTDLAGLVRMSPFHFARVFKAETGEAPAQFLRRRRIERALELLRDTRLSIAEIAYQTGFSSQSHLTNRIRAATGSTPGQIRGTLRGRHRSGGRPGD